MSITWKTGPNRGQFKQLPKNKKLMKKFHETWARRNGYREGASSRKHQAASAGRLEKNTILK
jgi:hypothetical protein